jgi:hypothetical protein
MSKDKKEEEFLESEEGVYTGLYKLLRSFSANLENPRNRWAVGQAISSLYLLVCQKQRSLFKCESRRPGRLVQRTVKFCKKWNPSTRRRRRRKRREMTTTREQWYPPPIPTPHSAWKCNTALAAPWRKRLSCYWH